MNGVFVTGTGTGVGKTRVSCLLLEAARRAGVLACGYKPVVCGEREDAYLLQRASGGEDVVTLDELNPVWLKSPASPMAAGMIEGREMDVDLLMAGMRSLADRYKFLLVEGAGGWEVPVRADYSMADLAVEMGLPVVVVVDNKLGALNHTILTVKALLARGLECVGIVLNQVEDERDSASISNRAVLEAVLPGVPVLLEVMHGETEVEWVFGGDAGTLGRG